MLQALLNARIHQRNGSWLDGPALLLNGKHIEALVDYSAIPAAAKRIDLAGNFLVPGFFDTQVNGGAGVLFNDELSSPGLNKIAEAHLRYGTTAMLPTLISDELSAVAKAIEAVEENMAEQQSSVVGIHLEGPFLNSERRGVHKADYFCALNEGSVELCSSLSTGATLITLAPEKNSSACIRALVERGVVVAVGHSAATYDQVCDALACGVSSFTHLFNAMSPLTSREPGVVGAALEHKHAWVGIIADGHHVHEAALRLALACKSKGKVVLVTDAMPSVGAEDKHFKLYGEDISVEAGRCLTKNGTLAGSDLDMLSAVRFCVDKLQLDLSEAINMASLYPAEMMALDDKLGSIEPGKEASLLELNKNLDLQQLWLKGRRTRFIV
ncbi:N-acetylglucosamine-6-phosphate deacetylase [Agaribacterium haliotis]|uniref:N-acetylglucosamine-6-phosphate deacetylase n=1 Tax=Agaribacterium haliotis TaxID=2013869 RepID=UPI000BB5514F|nr:N-acetylglucosamine-6-phosphate deacetylase [Agaribacterium haliotis]